MPTSVAPAAPAAILRTGRWRLDPDRSSVEFRVPHLFGLITVTGRFRRFEGVLDSRDPLACTITLSADPASLDTGKARRDAHLRSDDFFGTDLHPRLWFVSAAVALADGRMTADGELHAAGHHVRVTAEATLEERDGEVEIAATALVDQRTLGMTWSPLGAVRTPAELIVRGRLVRDDD